jgi:uncharacterized repeat protein (TIGR01451 family)
MCTNTGQGNSHSGNFTLPTTGALTGYISFFDQNFFSTSHQILDALEIHILNGPLLYLAGTYTLTLSACEDGTGTTVAPAGQTYTYTVASSPVTAPPVITPTVPTHANGANGVLVCAYSLTVSSPGFDPSVFICGPGENPGCDRGFRNHLWIPAPDQPTSQFFHIETQTLTPAPTAPTVHTTLTKKASTPGGPAPLEVTYTYTETNDGNVPLTGVAVTDPSCTPIFVSDTDSGDTSPSTELDPGETLTFTCSHTFTTAGTFTNTATATGMFTLPGSAAQAAPTETAQATVIVTPTNVNVHTTLTKMASPTAGQVPLTVTYTYKEINDGAQPITGVAVTDPSCTPIFVSDGDTGDVSPSTELDVGETLTFTCSHVFTTPGTFTNIATATGMFTLPGSAAQPATPETAQATVTVTPVRVNVHTTLTKMASPTSGQAPLTVTYTYSEHNDGNVPLTGVAVTDNACSPVTFVTASDIDGDGGTVLDPNETLTFTCTHTFTTAGTFTNTATATGLFGTQRAPDEPATATVTVTTKGDRDHGYNGKPGDHDKDKSKHKDDCDQESDDKSDDKSGEHAKAADKAGKDDSDKDKDTKDEDDCAREGEHQPSGGDNHPGGVPHVPTPEHGLTAPVSAVKPPAAAVAGTRLTAPTTGADVPIAPALVLTVGGMILLLVEGRRRSSATQD